MTDLRQNLHNLIDKIPEEKLPFVAQIVEGINGLRQADDCVISDSAKKRKAFNDLQQLIDRHTPTSIDYKNELQKSLGEMYENADLA